MGKIYDLTHNITAYFSDLRSDAEISLVDDIVVSLYSYEMKPIESVLVSGAPIVTSTYPTNNSSGVVVTTNPVITFDQSMIEESVQNAIEISPFTVISNYTWNTNDTQLTLEFNDNMKSGVVYDIKISSEAISGEQIPMYEDYTLTFLTEI